MSGPEPIEVIFSADARNPSYFIGKRIKVGDKINYMQPGGTILTATISRIIRGVQAINDNYAIFTDKGVFGMATRESPAEPHFSLNQVYGIGATEQMLVSGSLDDPEPIEVIFSADARNPGYFIGKRIKVGDKINYMQPGGTILTATISRIIRGVQAINDNYAIFTDKGVFGMATRESPAEPHFSLNQVYGIGATERMLHRVSGLSGRSGLSSPSVRPRFGGVGAAADVRPKGSKRSRHRRRNRTRKSVR